MKWIRNDLCNKAIQRGGTHVNTNRLTVSIIFSKMTKTSKYQYSSSLRKSWQKKSKLKNKESSEHFVKTSSKNRCNTNNIIPRQSPTTYYCTNKGPNIITVDSCCGEVMSNKCFRYTVKMAKIPMGTPATITANTM